MVNMGHFDFSSDFYFHTYMRNCSDDLFLGQLICLQVDDSQFNSGVPLPRDTRERVSAKANAGIVNSKNQIKL